MVRMRWLVMALFGASVLGCGPDGTLEDRCGLGLERPELPIGSARYVRDTLSVTATGGGYRLGFPNDIVIGPITLNIKQDRDRRLVEELVRTSSFPICVPLDGSDDGSGYAFVEDGAGSFATSAEHSGMLAILAKSDDALIGRFAFEAGENMGSRITRVEDGAFNLQPR